MGNHAEDVEVDPVGEEEVPQLDDLVESGSRTERMSELDEMDGRQLSSGMASLTEACMRKG